MTFAGTPSQILRQWRAMLKPAFRADPRHSAKPDAEISVPCGSCTACCRSAFPVPLEPDEAQRLPHVMVGGQPHLPHRGRDCALFDPERNRCSIYEQRPKRCREYDCRALWLAGFRNRSVGEEMNARLNEWRTQVHNDLDLGIVAYVWRWAREKLAADPAASIGPIAGGAVMRAAFETDDDLRKLGRKARRGGVVHVLKVLNGQR